MTLSPPVRTRVDPVTLEVIRARLIAIVTEMSVTLSRTAYSTIIRDVHDFSCVVFDGRGRLIAQAEGIPSFNGSMKFALDAVRTKFPLTTMQPGDVFVSNDPYFAEGSSFHKNDINILTPIFHDGQLVMIAASKAHHLDVGGKSAGSYAPDAKSTFQEGLNLPPVKLVDGGIRNEAVLDILLGNVRVPNIVRGDLFAQLAAATTAERRAHDLLARYEPAVLEDASDLILDHAERTTRSAIEQIADGRYVARGFHDGDGTTADPIPLCVAVTVDGSDIEVDVTGSARQRPSSGGNGHWHTTVAMTRETIMFLSDTTLGANEGSYRPISVIAPKGCVFRPVSPAPTTTGTADLSVRLIELILEALAPVLPEAVIAGTFGTVSALTLAGAEPEEEEFVHFSPYAGGWGARARKDGNSAMVSLLSGDNYNVPCEVMETRFPALIAESYSLRADSAGPGRHRGGLGVSYDYRLLGATELSVALDHYAFPPAGIFGGTEAQGSALLIDPEGQDERVLHSAGGVHMPAGTVISHRTAGGGGYGDPFERDPAAVLEDVRNAVVTPQAAQEHYGVVVNEDKWSLNAERTALRRASARENARSRV